MNNYVKGGRGKKAPYETVHYRIPEPIKPTVRILADKYRQLSTAQSGSEADEMLERVQSAIANHQVINNKPDTRFNEGDLEQVVFILHEALKLKANAGGKIKERIREAISIIGNFNV